MALPTNVGTGTVIGTFIDSVGVAAAGTITFTPSPSRLLDPTASPAPVTILPRAITVNLSSGSFSQVLVATDDTDLNPVGWTYTVSFNFTNITAPASFSIPVPQGTVVDLAVVAPVTAANGTVYTAGVGVPAGGTTGQALVKVNGTDYNTTWTTISGGSSTVAQPPTGLKVVLNFVYTDPTIARPTVASYFSINWIGPPGSGPSAPTNMAATDTWDAQT